MNTRDPTTPLPLGTLDWGGLRNFDPVSERWGFDRGRPVDRYFIEAFLGRYNADIRGHCIEVMNGNYVKKFGGDRVTRCDVIDINRDNPKATLTGDLVDPKTLPRETYDCFVLTQTLPVIFDGASVIRNCFRSLRKGGVLLVTAPCLCRYSPHPEDHWRFTDRSLERLLRDNTDCEELSIEMKGNLVAAIAFLTGLAAEELTKEELELNDVRFPVVVTARVTKGGA